MTDKNDKKKAGLHKEISSIFDGVPIPSNQGMARPHLGPPGPQPGQAGYDSPRPVPRGPENPQIPGAPQQFRQAGRPGAPAHARARTADQGALRRVTRKLFGHKEGVSAKRQIVMAVLVPILLVVLIIVLTKVLGASSSKSTWSPKPVATAGQAGAEIDWRMPEPYPAGLRDPMQLTAEMTAQIEAEAIAKTQAVAVTPGDTGTTEQEPAKPQELAVTGILFSQDNPSAVIGTRIAHVGDTIAGATIVKINLTTVEFEKDGKSWTQTLEP